MIFYCIIRESHTLRMAFSTLETSCASSIRQLTRIFDHIGIEPFLLLDIASEKMNS